MQHFLWVDNTQELCLWSLNLSTFKTLVVTCRKPWGECKDISASEVLMCHPNSLARKATKTQTPTQQPQSFRKISISSAISDRTRIPSLDGICWLSWQCFGLCLFCFRLLKPTRDEESIRNPSVKEYQIISFTVNVGGKFSNDVKFKNCR